MYAVIRDYTGASALTEALDRLPENVETVLSAVPGFVSYYAVRNGDRLTAITICEDERGAEESTRRAAEWVRENLPGVSISPPQVSDGEVFLHFARQQASVPGP